MDTDDFSPKVIKLSKFWEPIVGVAALVTVPLLFLEKQLDPILALALNAAIWAVFSAEFVTTLVACQGRAERRAYVRSSVLDILIILGSFPILPSTLQSLRILRVGRATRVIRILRLGRVFALGWILRWARKRFRLNPLLFSGTSTVIAVFVGANAFHILEPELAPGLGHALWWAVTTVTTVGYGDISPTTDGGRAVGVCLMVAGVAGMAAFSGALASYLVQHPAGSEKSEAEKLDEVLAELKALRAEVAELKQTAG